MKEHADKGKREYFGRLIEAVKKHDYSKDPTIGPVDDVPIDKKDEAALGSYGKVQVKVSYARKIALQKNAGVKQPYSDREVEPAQPNRATQHHVVPNRDRGGWDVKRDHAERSSNHFDTKQPAIDKARTISQNQGTELYIHNRQGQIINRDSHGNDPKKSKG